MKVAELKDELKARGLDTGGKKADLAARLTASLASTVEEDNSDAAAPAPPSPKKASPKKASPKMSPKKSPKAAPKATPKATSGALHKGKVWDPDFGAEDHEAMGQYMMCVGPILAHV